MKEDQKYFDLPSFLFVTLANMKRKLLSFFLTACGLLGVTLQAQSQQEAPNPNYIIQSSDVIRLQVFQEPDLEQEFRVPRNGEYQFPLIGVVDVSGKTVAEVEGHLRDLYNKDYLVNPQLNLLIVEYAQRRVNVLGAVNSPGTIIFPPEEEMTLLDAISRAGGFNRLAARGRVILTRAGPDGKVTKYTVDVDKIIGGKNSSAWKLQKDDTIYVPESFL